MKNMQTHGATGDDVLVLAVEVGTQRSEKQEPRTDKDLKELAFDIYAGRALLGSQVPPELVKVVFLPLYFMDKEQWKELVADLGKGGDIVGRMDDALSRSINGYPIFARFSVLSTEERKKVHRYIEAFKTLYDEV